MIVGLPVLLLVLTELQSNLERRGNSLHKVIGLLRNAVVPIIAILILSVQVTDAVDPGKPVVNQIIGTVLGFLVIVFVLNGLNIMLFTNAREGSWREKIPSIFVDIARIVLIALGLALVFKIVWGADVGGSSPRSASGRSSSASRCSPPSAGDRRAVPALRAAVPAR